MTIKTIKVKTQRKAKYQKDHRFFQDLKVGNKTEG